MAIRQLGYPTTDSGYDLWVLIGQSNMAGQNAGPDTGIDIADPDIWTYGYTGSYANTIAIATDPLGHQHRNTATGVGPGLPFARWVKNIGALHRRILLVPAAYDGTVLVSTTAPTWNSATAGSLYANAVTATTKALTAAGSNARLAGILWLQGESDALASVTGTNYATALDALINAFRTQFSNPTLPFLVLGMPPEDIYLNSTGTTWAAIAQAHASTPARVAYTGYTVGPAGFSMGDQLHYTAAGARALGTRALATYLAAIRKTTASAVFTAAADPLITGTTTVGNVLTARSLFSSTPDTTTYQWYRGTTAISGATASTYTLVSADNGNQISVAVTGNKSGFTSVTVTSPQTNTVGASGVNATDSFNRTGNASSMGTTETGNLTWSPVNASTWGITGNQAYNASNTSAALVAVESGSANHTAQVTMAALDTGTSLMVRLTDANNWIAVLYQNGTGSIQVYRTVGGSGAFVSLTGSSSFAAGDVLKCVMSGGTGTISRNGTQVITFSDSTTGTKVGLRSDSSTGRFDDFSVTA